MLDPARMAQSLDRIDSFDLISLHMAIEASLDVPIPDREWSGVGSLADIAKLPSLAATAAVGAPLATVAPLQAPVAIQAAAQVTTSGRSQRDYTLNMPQMALSGLGEFWLFKELGDIHWAMITAFLQSPSSGITDETGDRLYATFTRIQLGLTPDLRAFRENDPFSIASALERYGAAMFFGPHELTSQTGGCRARTMSTFEPPRVYRRAKLSENCPLWNRHQRRRPRSRIHLSSANVRCGWRWNIAMIIKAKLRR